MSFTKVGKVCVLGRDKINVRHMRLWSLGNGNPSEDVQGLEYAEIWSRNPGYYESMVIRYHNLRRNLE